MRGQRPSCMGFIEASRHAGSQQGGLQRRTRGALLLFLLTGGVTLPRPARPSSTSTSPPGAAPPATHTTALASVRTGVSGSYLERRGATGGKIQINRGALKWRRGGVLLGS